MALNKKDSAKVSYKAKIDWYKERFASVIKGEPLDGELPDKDVSVFSEDETRILSKEEREFLSTVSTPDELIEVLGDLTSKAEKLDKRIDKESDGLKIAVDKEKNPLISEYVEELDSASKGEYISYDLYKRLSEQQELALSKIEINDLIDGLSISDDSNSIIINSKLSEGLAEYNDIKPLTAKDDNEVERYSNRYLNNASSWNEHDYNTKQIMNFADNYLGMFPDPAYIPWALKRDVRSEVVSSKNLGDFWKSFSSHFTGQANKIVSGVTGLSKLDSDKRIHDLTKRTIHYCNNFLNGIDQIFEMNYGADLICCFIKWSGSLDTKALKGLRALLQLFRNGLSLDFGDILASLGDIINNIFRGLLTDQLVGVIKQISQRLVDPIKRWINNPDPRWKKIFTCTPIDEFINNFVVYSVEYVENLLVKLIQNWYKSIELKRIKNDLKIELFGNQKQLSIFIQLLDLVISALERSAICGTSSSPTGDEVQKIMSAYKIGPAKPYVYPKEDDPNIYNSFIPVSPPEASDESLAEKTSAKFDTGTLMGGVGDGVSRFDECLQKVMPEDVVKLTDWMRK